MHADPPETLELLHRVVAGDDRLWGEMVGRVDGRLRQMVDLRLDPRVRQRVSASDILQEVYLEAVQHLPRYVEQPRAPFYLWLRGIAANKLLHCLRHHLGVEMRDARREARLASEPQTQTATLARLLADQATRPSQALVRDELRDRLQQALEALEPADREIVALRHFEQLSNGEAAGVLGIDPSAASKRYIRALGRLKAVVDPRLLGHGEA